MFKRFVYLLATTALATFAQGNYLNAAVADDVAKPVATEKPTLTQDNEALFKQLDKNSDGQFTKDELPEKGPALTFRRLFLNADKDGDGKLSREEFIAGLKSGREQKSQSRESAGRGGLDLEDRFLSMDRNADGKITIDDVPEGRRERFAESFQSADKDGDKAVTLDEFKKASGFLGGRPDGPPPGAPNGPPPGGDVLFRTLDADRDGELSGDELAKAADALKKLDKDGDGKVTRRELLPPREGGGPEGSSRPAPEQLIRRLMAGDKNNDGKLSREELPQRLQRDFDRLDANGDASVSADELKSGLERLREAGGGRGAEALKRRLEKTDGKKE